MGRLTFEDEPRTGRPSTEVTPELIEAVSWEVVKDPHITYLQSEETLKISSPAINTIVHL